MPIIFFLDLFKSLIEKYEKLEGFSWLLQKGSLQLLEFICLQWYFEFWLLFKEVAT